MPGVIRRHGAYVAFVTTSLALAVGATLVVFTIVNALWLRSLPFPDHDRLVMLMSETTGSDESVTFGGLEAPDGWTAFEAVAGQVATSAGFDSLRPHVLIEQVGGAVETLGVTSQYFRLLGQPIRGRDFTRDDNRRGAEPVVIISDRLWARAFARRPDAIGAVVPAKPFPVRIVGVAPRGFEGARRGERADVWIPSNLVPRVALASSGASALPENALPFLVFARLYEGQTSSDAERRLVQNAVGEMDRRVAWLAAGGTAGALLIAFWSLRVLPALSLPGGVDLGRLDLSIDWRVLSVGLLTTVLTLVAAAIVH
jgi:MacB-like periplasmic core domain